MLRVRTTFGGITGTPYLSTMYFTGDDSPAGAAAANAAVGAWWGAIDNSLINGITWATEGDVDELTVAGVLTNSYGVTPVTGVGTVVGALAPPATQALVRWRTGTFIGGRELRGRTFIPGIPTSMISAGMPTGTLATNMNANITALLGAAGPDLAIWSKVNSTAANVDSGSLWSQFAVLRSRRD